MVIGMMLMMYDVEDEDDDGDDGASTTLYQLPICVNTYQPF